jgi:hypothetical protein
LIDHPKAGHDDAVNTALGCAWLLSRQSSSMRDGYESNITYAIRDYDPNAAPVSIRQPSRHMHLLPINLRLQCGYFFASHSRL